MTPAELASKIITDYIDAEDPEFWGEPTFDTLPECRIWLREVAEQEVEASAVGHLEYAQIKAEAAKVLVHLEGQAGRLREMSARANRQGSTG